MFKTRQRTRRYLYSGLVAMLVLLAACGAEGLTESINYGEAQVQDPTTYSDESGYNNQSPYPFIEPHEFLNDKDPVALDSCAYEGEVGCGYQPDDPVPGVCTPDYAGDIACRTFPDLLNDMYDLYSKNN